MDVRRELRRIGRIAGFGGLTGSLLTGFLAHEALTAAGERDAVRERWVRTWCTGHLALFGVTVAVDGASPPRTPGRGRMVVADHRSTADILVLLRAFGGHMVSRADLARWPLVGKAARAVGTLFVERGDAVSGARALRTIRTTLARGATVIVFPEGTTFAEDAVQPFQIGSFVAAVRAGAESSRRASHTPPAPERRSSTSRSRRISHGWPRRRLRARPSASGLPSPTTRPRSPPVRATSPTRPCKPW